MLTKINDRISYIKATPDPLSADIGIVTGNTKIFIFDVGANPEPLSELNTVLLNNPDKLPVFVLSHFHSDHTGNIVNIDFPNIYGGQETIKHIKKGTVVAAPLAFSDGVEIKIFPIPSSHAKGCIGMSIDDEFAFMGDAAYSAEKDNKQIYNKNLLKDEIEFLKTLPAKKLLLSHKERFIYPKNVIIRQLESVYANASKDDMYIYI